MELERLHVRLPRPISAGAERRSAVPVLEWAREGDVPRRAQVRGENGWPHEPRMGMPAPDAMSGPARPTPAAAAGAQLRPRAQHPVAAGSPQAGGGGGARRGADRRGDHALHRQHAVRLPASCHLRLLDRGQPRLIPGVPRWDPSFVVLAMMASVEAIFLSTFVLISQNRMAAAADKRADLDLQISLLAEHEVTKLVTWSPGSPIAWRSGRRPTPSSTRSSRTSRPKPCSTRSRRPSREPGRVEAESPRPSASRNRRRPVTGPSSASGQPPEPVRVPRSQPWRGVPLNTVDPRPTAARPVRRGSGAARPACR